MIYDELRLTNPYRVTKLSNTGARNKQLNERINEGHFNIFKNTIKNLTETMLRYYFTNYSSC